MSLPTEMTCIAISQPGGPAVLKPVKRPLPQPAFVDQQDIEPRAPSLQRRPETHDATAHDQQIDRTAPLTGKVRRFIAFGHGQGNSRKTRGRKASAA